MLRVLGIPALLVAVVVGLYLSAQDMRSNGPASPAGRQQIAQAQSVGAAENFNQALPALQAFYAENGTYAGATLAPGSGVVVARADATSYCLESAGEHEDGPGGQPQPGPC